MECVGNYLKVNSEYKYCSEMSGVPACPPDSIEEATRLAVRFVHACDCENDEMQKSFVPVAKLSPGRRLRPDQKCKAHGLSLYDSRDSAKKAMNHFCKFMKNAPKTLGDRFAEGTITPTHGKCDQPDDKGHFTLYEYEDSELAAAFSPIPVDFR